MYKKYRKGVFVVAYAIIKGRPSYLILHRKLNWTGWEFPKGGSLAREKLENSILREIKEEGGLRAFSIKNHNYSEKFIYDVKTQIKKKREGFIFKLYSCQVEKKNVKWSIEHDGFRWCNFSEALRLLTWENQKKCLRIVDGKIRKSL